jgi:hypothetical protein
MIRGMTLSPFFLILFGIILSGSLGAEAARLPSLVAKEIGSSSIKGIARVKTVTTIQNGQRYSNQKTLFELVQPLFDTKVPQKFVGNSMAVLHKWQKPGVGGEHYDYPVQGTLVFVTVGGDGGLVTSLKNLEELSKETSPPPKFVFLTL